MPLAIVPQIYTGELGLLTFRRKHAEEGPGVRRRRNTGSQSGASISPDHPPQVVHTGVAVPASPNAEAAAGVVIQDPHHEVLRKLDSEWQQCFEVIRGLHIDKKLKDGTWSTMYVVIDSKGFNWKFVLKATPMVGALADCATAQIAQMRSLQHPNIITFHETFIHKVARTSFLCIKMDYCKKGSLREVLEKEKGRGLPASRTGDFLLQISSALGYIHERGVLHGDLRLGNILCTSDDQLKLTNFAASTVVPRQSDIVLSLTGGQRMYAPPEWVNSAFSRRPLQSFEIPESSYDMWGFGCILSELVTARFIEGDRVTPTDALASNEMAFAGVLQDLNTAHQGAFSAMGRQLLQADPDARMTARAAVAVLEALLPQLPASHGSRGSLSLPSLRTVLSART